MVMRRAFMLPCAELTCCWARVWMLRCCYFPMETTPTALHESTTRKSLGNISPTTKQTLFSLKRVFCSMELPTPHVVLRQYRLSYRAFRLFPTPYCAILTCTIVLNGWEWPRLRSSTAWTNIYAKAEKTGRPKRQEPITSLDLPLPNPSLSRLHPCNKLLRWNECWWNRWWDLAKELCCAMWKTKRETC